MEDMKISTNPHAPGREKSLGNWEGNGEKSEQESPALHGAPAVEYVEPTQSEVAGSGTRDPVDPALLFFQWTQAVKE